MSNITPDELARILEKPGYSVFRDGKGAVAKLERNHAASKADADTGKKPDSKRFVVRITSFRRRLLDEDNLCGKFHCDALRYAGIIRSDAPEKCAIQILQVKVKSKREECTLMELLQ